MTRPLSIRKRTLYALIALTLLGLFNAWAVSRIWYHEPDLLFTWRKGPLIKAESPYSSYHAARYLWPAVAGALDIYLLALVGWFAAQRRLARDTARRLAPLAATAALLLGLTAGELGIRAAVNHFQLTQYHPDPELFWYNRPNLRDHADATDPAPRSTNRHGFRGTDDLLEPKAEDELRIFIVGDSSTFGLGVEDHEAYCFVLQRELEEATGKRVRIINTASPGHTSYQGWILWQRWADRFEPDILLWAYNNDSCLDMVEESTRLARRSALVAIERLLFRSDLYLMARQVVLDNLRAADKEAFRETYPSEQEGWVKRIPYDAYRDYLADFECSALERHAHTIFVRMPLNSATLSTHPIYTTSYDEAYRDYLSEEFCQQGGRHCADFERDFLGRGLQGLFLPEHLFHPSPKGHAIIGESLARLILDHGLLEPPTAACAETNSD
jgi:lysophospholipase L1-like esterase